MYTSTPCNVPSGQVPISSDLLNAAAQAAMQAVASGASVEQAGPIVQQAISAFFQANPTTPNQPNSAVFARNAGYQAACRAMSIRQQRQAQRGFNRLLERRVSDWAGVQVQAGEFNQPEHGTRNDFRRKLACTAPGPAPEVVPIESSFSYESNPTPLTTAPLAPVQPIPPAGTPAPVQDCRTGDLCVDIRNGCVLSSSVSTEQLLACAQRGIVGNYNLFPAIAARGGMHPSGMGALKRGPARPMRRLA
jgi:hypothetical protein